MEIAIRSILSVTAKAAVPALLALATIGWQGPAAAISQPKLLPHAAGYSVKIEATSSLGSIASGRGALQLEWQRDCDGFAYSQQSILTLNYANGPSVDSEVRISSWEAADASSYRFIMRNAINQEVTSEVDGQATRLPDGSLSVAYSIPEEKTLPLPAGVIFPWQQMRRLFEKATAGEQQDWQTLLRGEAEGDPANVSIRILPMTAPLPTDLGEVGDLLPKAGWHFISAYYEAPAKTLPDFEISETILASGVITRADITYPDFTMHIRLNKLTQTPTPDCAR